MGFNSGFKGLMPKSRTKGLWPLAHFSVEQGGFALENIQPTSVYRKGAEVQDYEGISSGPGTFSAVGPRGSSGSSVTLPSALTSDKSFQLPNDESSRTVSAGLDTFNKKLTH